jgi:glucosamine--fructose-6-phosphate aminotransferase (isomerizing)
VVYLNDYDIVTITKDSYDVQSHQGTPAEVKVSRVEFSADEAEKGDFPHFMLKEIYEQPNSSATRCAAAFPAMNAPPCSAG